MHQIDPQSWKQDLPAFQMKMAEFYNGTLDKASYKGFSGLYGSYAQKGGQASMLRLRMTAGRVTKEKLAFTAKAIREHAVPRAHFTTCQTIQLHDLDQGTVCSIMEQALDAGIVTMGGGGDFPRNVMCSPLSGVEQGEYFDVLPWAEAAGEYLMHFIKAEKMPRKLKVGFSNSPKNMTHATFRDLGFAARPDGTFDVYSAGGLGNNPRFGVLAAQAVAPEKILYYIKAMWLTFRAYGNYENRGKARTRYMQEVCGGPEGYAKAYQEKLAEVLSVTADSARSLFETSVSCIGGKTCQVGTRDSQGLLAACVAAVREAGVPDGTLPQMHISGCPSSCGTHQTGAMGVRGTSKLVDGKPQPAFALFVGGCDAQGRETMGKEVGVLLEKDIPAFLVELGKTVAASGMDYDAWSQTNPEGTAEVAKAYLG